MASAQPEPSMEEILASIRRIISEDDHGEEDGSAGIEQGSSRSEDKGPSRQDEDSAPGFLTAEKKPSASDRSTFLESKSASASPIAAEPDGAGSASTDRSLGATDVGQSGPFSLDAGSRDERALDQAPVAAPTTSARTSGYGSAMSALESESNETHLIDDMAAGIASDSFRSLARSIRVSSEGEKTLEDIVTDLLKPLIKEWLDQHLASIVEEKVQDEVERIARRGR